MPIVSATAPRSTPALDLSVPRTDAPQRRHRHDHDEVEQREASAPRRNPLVAAMMQALGSLMPSSKSTAAQDAKPAASDASATPAAAPPDASSSLKDAAMAFAHELFDALRSAGSGRDSGDSASENGHGHHHHHGHGRGYGDLAQRLERLAAEVATPAQPADPAQPDAAVSITASLTTASISTSSGADGSSSTSVNLTTVNLSLTQQAAPAQATKESPLLSAFRKLFDALQPASAGDAAKPDAASGLASFLRQLAQSLRSGQDAAAPALPTQGSLISVSA